MASFLLWPRYDVLMVGNPREVARFATFLMLLVALTISFIFDLKWSELPMVPLIAGGVLGAVMLGINVT